MKTYPGTHETGRAIIIHESVVINGRFDVCINEWPGPARAKRWMQIGRRKNNPHIRTRGLRPPGGTGNRGAFVEARTALLETENNTRIWFQTGFYFSSFALPVTVRLTDKKSWLIVNCFESIGHFENSSWGGYLTLYLLN